MNMIQALDNMSLQEVENLIFNIELDIMDNLLRQKMSEGKMVFSEVENGLAN